MSSPGTQDLAALYTLRHSRRQGIFGDKPYANYGYWPRAGMSIEEACDALTDLVVGAVALGPGDRVLEVGCGYAAGAVHYTHRYLPASVRGIDVTEVRIQDAREYIAANGLADTIRVDLGDATALAFGAGAFTKVIAIECAFHFRSRRDFIREAARVLAPGGGLAMTDAIPRRGVSREEYLAKVHLPVGSNGEYDVPENVYDADVYAGHLRTAGFTDVRVDPISAQTLPHFVEHVDRLAAQAEGERADLLRRAAQCYRDYLQAGLEYVLVAARRS